MNGPIPTVARGVLAPLIGHVVTFSHYSKRPNSPMHDVVVSAVRKAVRAATIIFTASSMIRFFVITE